MDISNRRRHLDPSSAAREGEVRSIAGGRQLPIDPSRYLDPSSAARPSEVRSIMDPRYYLDSEYEQAKSYSKMIDPSSAARPSELRQVAEDPLMPDIDPRAVIRDDEYQRIIKIVREGEDMIREGVRLRDHGMKIAESYGQMIDPSSAARPSEYGQAKFYSQMIDPSSAARPSEYELAESYSKIIDPSSAARPSEVRRMLAGPYDQVIDPSSMKIRHGE